MRLAAVLSFVLFAVPALAQSEHQHHPSGDGGDRLGTITFPASGRAEAHADFLRGVLYMHSFEYAHAAEAFRAAQQKDPDFGMAYWGEAMTYTHPIWNEQDLSAARAVLHRLAPTADERAARMRTSRERAWLNAVEVLYGEGSKPRRDTLYARAMEQLAADYPDDDEARAFLALAILGLSQGVRDVPAYIRAGAIALDVLHRNADHPGAAHYVIHAFDDPTHAPLGLNAARAYSRIAPGAAHAQHMTTHIFLALGMWPEVISQNVVASGPERSRWTAGHYTYWLHYGLLQAGRTEEAATLLDELRAREQASPDARQRMHLVLARSQQVVTGERWNDPSLSWELELAPRAARLQAIGLFSRGYAALRRGASDEATASLQALRAMVEQGTDDGVLPLLERQLRAAVARAEGDREAAERELRELAAAAAALPVEFGPPDFVKPPYELLGEWLLEDGRPAEARAAFERSLELTPGRLLSKRGLSEANRILASAP